MLFKMLSAVAVTSGIGLLSLASSIMPSAIAQTTDYREVMENDDFSLWNSGESRGVAFNVWSRKGKAGGGYYYFMWKAPYASVEDRGDPEVVVFFDSNITRLDSEYLVDCYNDGSYGQLCEEPEKKPAHYRYAGPCIFFWQVAADGSMCGERSAIAWPGQFE
ncbi:MAG: hypothetical protein DCF25_15965 [Leptolyngbya foveolarum]|uniref:Uncharacterized protein n=1 Tax=Leptolyngbya foveolarum TaxID=47253 RepID=A0A2W4U3H5_9CYAN|nr:MAG: hypothetical protein DCF25_15965 [Leptolyngbya foveolarum]